MAPKPTKNVKVHLPAHRKLSELQTALESQRLPGYVEHADIVSAMIMYTPVPQLSGMLAEYWENTREQTQKTES
jgi:hypothetical protein